MTQYLKLALFTLICLMIPLWAETPQNQANSPTFLPEEFNAPINENPDRFLGEFLNMLAMLGLILLILLAVTWFLKKVLNAKIQQTNSTSGIQILERRPLSPKSTLFLVEVGGKGVVVADSVNGVTYITTVPLNEDSIGHDELQKEKTVPPSNFSSFLEPPKS